MLHRENAVEKRKTQASFLPSWSFCCAGRDRLDLRITYSCRITTGVHRQGQGSLRNYNEAFWPGRTVGEGAVEWYKGKTIVIASFQRLSYVFFHKLVE